ncbi:MAG: ribonuclease HI [Gemmatimonadetes bacterium]|nr:ribonuclease HI [Gemmatimonadota bacterium]
MASMIRIWADESCLGVQFVDRDSPGGAGGLVEHWTSGGWVRRDYWLSEPATTNNRMALRSAITGLALLRRACRVVFTSDSQYLVRGMREWIHTWSRRGWKRKGGAIENEDLWRELAHAARRHQVDWRWVRGHAGHPHNEYANHLATRAAREQTSSNGLVPSGFVDWLGKQREESQRYLDFMEWTEPPADAFNPVPVVPT